MCVMSLVYDTTATSRDDQGFEGLIAAAEAVVAVRIISTDYTAVPSNGPMVATAKVLRAVKGTLEAGRTFTFAETAWVGPTYQKEELRILFLEKAKPAESHQPGQWRVLSDLYTLTDFFIDKDSVSALTLDSLETFLRKMQQLKPKPKRVVFDAKP